MELLRRGPAFASVFWRVISFSDMSREPREGRWWEDWKEGEVLGGKGSEKVVVVGEVFAYCGEVAWAVV